MNSPAGPPHDPSRHRRAQPGGARKTFQEEPVRQSESVSENNSPAPDWRAPLDALEQRHAGRLAQLEERLLAAERTAGDLAGQMKNLR
jgi:hypothetical protein